VKGASNLHIITDADLLHANATIIAGILIFLTIAPFSRGAVPQIRERKTVLNTIYATLTLLLMSMLIIFFPGYLSYEVSLFTAKTFSIMGLFGVGTAIVLIMRALPKVGTEQRRQDE